MRSDREIGKIILVNSYSVLIELNIDSKSYVKSSYTGTFPIGVINSYVIIPVGADRIVGIVTKVQMREESLFDPKAQHLLSLPTASRTMWATLVGTITERDKKKEFNYGINRYPELDNSVWLITDEELGYIFRHKTDIEDERAHYITVGSSPIFSNYDVKIDMNSFFGKHAAILGNTGSGKSCTVKAIIDAVLNRDTMPNTHFIIFDTNNEYEKAFTKYGEDNLIDEIYFNRLVIRNEGDVPTGLFLPHWFMNGRDFEALFTPAPQTQAPILSNSISRARGTEVSLYQSFLFFQVVQRSISRIRERMGDTNGPVTKDIRQQALPYKGENESLEGQITNIKQEWPEFDEKKYFEKFDEILQIIPNPGPNWVALDASLDIPLSGILTDIENYLQEDMRQLSTKFVDSSIISIDTPNPFSFEEFRQKHILDEIQEQERQDPRVRQNIGTLLLRIDRMFRDPRYNYLFKTEPFDDSLASFLRYIFGEEPDENFNQNSPPWKKYYDEQVKSGEDIKSKKHNITILDFSNIASDVLENTVALIGRLILEFMQRIKPRGSFPLVLILEEAHRYIPFGSNLSERQLRAKEVFERIAKEGRKYGLSLVVSSQRPSELSKTVLSQCNSFIVHRIQNPDDKEYFKAIMPSVSRDILDQLPALAQQNALIIGECVTIPVQVRITDVDPKPDSQDPDFYEKWSSKEPIAPDFEEICKNWEKGK